MKDGFAQQHTFSLSTDIIRELATKNEGDYPAGLARLRVGAVASPTPTPLLPTSLGAAFQAKLQAAQAANPAQKALKVCTRLIVTSADLSHDLRHITCCRGSASACGWSGWKMQY